MFGEASVFQDEGARGVVESDARIVRDEKRGEVLLGGGVSEDAENVGEGLRVNVRGRLVGEKQPRPGGESGDGEEPGALSAGEFVREGGEVAGEEAEFFGVETEPAAAERRGGV